MLAFLLFLVWELLVYNTSMLPSGGAHARINNKHSLTGAHKELMCPHEDKIKLKETFMSKMILGSWYL